MAEKHKYKCPKCKCEFEAEKGKEECKCPKCGCDASSEKCECCK